MRWKSTAWHKQTPATNHDMAKQLNVQTQRGMHRTPIYQAKKSDNRGMNYKRMHENVIEHVGRAQAAQHWQTPARNHANKQMDIQEPNIMVDHGDVSTQWMHDNQQKPFVSNILSWPCLSTKKEDQHKAHVLDCSALTLAKQHNA